MPQSRVVVTGRVMIGSMGLVRDAESDGLNGFGSSDGDADLEGRVRRWRVVVGLLGNSTRVVCRSGGPVLTSWASRSQCGSDCDATEEVIG